MSCAPQSEMVQTKIKSSIKHCSGFLFAFYNFSQVPETTLTEKFVHMVTGSDSIHVAILPVPYCRLKVTECISEKSGTPSTFTSDICVLYVEDITYTAFIGSGYDILPASTVLNTKYKYMFIPVDAKTQYNDGNAFLQSLKGSGYNYFGLTLTVLPRVFKLPVRDSEFISHGAPSRVFCSQVGLMLLYRCGMAPQAGIDPSCCTPGDLQRILSQKEGGGGISCGRNLIIVSNPHMKRQRKLTASTSSWCQSLF
jgi:hypothetical protein